jgi:hypothetical protein
VLAVTGTGIGRLAALTSQSSGRLPVRGQAVRTLAPLTAQAFSIPPTIVPPERTAYAAGGLAAGRSSTAIGFSRTATVSNPGTRTAEAKP